MGAERDPAGSTGPGLSGAGYGSSEGTRETTGFTTPSSGETMGDRTGSAEVHTGLHSGTRGGSEELSALGFAQEGTTLKDRVIGRARTVAGSVRDGAGSLGTRATEAAGQARTRLGEVSERTNRALEQRGLLSRLQENPLPALGIAFGLGFLVAGGGRGGASDSPTSRVRRELRSALMAGLTAGAAQATRGFLQSAGRSDGALSSLFGGAAEGSAGASSRGGTTAGSRGRMSSRMAGEDTEGRPPSHREDL
jgi:hypothetical protein